MAVKPRWDTRKLNLANGLIAVQSMRTTTLSPGENDLMGLLRSLTAVPLLCLLAACGSAAGNSNNAAGAPVSANAVTSTALPAVSDPTAFKLGANPATIQYWDGSRPFMNLLYGSSWQMAGSGRCGRCAGPISGFEWLGEIASRQDIASSVHCHSPPRAAISFAASRAMARFGWRTPGDERQHGNRPDAHSRSPQAIPALSRITSRTVSTLPITFATSTAARRQHRRRDLLTRIPVDREWLQGPAVREVDAVGRVRIQAIPVKRSQRRTSYGRRGISLEMATISRTTAPPLK